jgi:hypothetical protein
MTLAEEILQSGRHVGICDIGEGVYELAVAAIDEAIEHCAQVTERAKVSVSYCVGRDLLTVDNGAATLRNAAESIRSLKSNATNSPTNPKQSDNGSA